MVTSPNRSVKFGKITIREYDVTVGDNPACSVGVPISLGWKYNPHHEQYPVEVYERYRSGQRCDDSDELKLHEFVRLRILNEWNVPKSKIKRAERTCRIVKDQRQQTIEDLALEEEKKRNLHYDSEYDYKFGNRRLKNLTGTFQKMFKSQKTLYSQKRRC
mmetsp:Transcript_22609/g.28532  ORF Transcript_22609/g.28532 Transcript_22609/m.28532 type:complete len:160 (+) Transcript_22609:153-632(+)